MTQRLYRSILVTTVLVWLQVGMHLSHMGTIKDRGGTPEPSEWLVSMLLTIWGAVGVVVLWQQPTASRLESDAPVA